MVNQESATQSKFSLALQSNIIGICSRLAAMQKEGGKNSRSWFTLSIRVYLFIKKQTGTPDNVPLSAPIFIINNHSDLGC